MIFFFQETELFQFVTPFKNLVVDFGKDDCIKDFFTFFQLRFSLPAEICRVKLARSDIVLWLIPASWHLCTYCSMGVSSSWQKVLF